MPSPTLPRRRKNAGAQASSPGSAMSGDLVWNSLKRSFVGSDSGPGKGFHQFPRSFRIGDPLVVELIGACRDAAVAFAGIDHSGITTVHQLEEMIFGLSVLACVADQHLRKLGVLNAVILFATLPKRAAIKADDRRVSEIGIDAVEAGAVADVDIDVVCPRQRLGHPHLLIP